MILVDANLLVHAWNEDSLVHHAADEWLTEKLNGTARVGLPWPSLLAFVRLVSNPRVFTTPMPVGEAWEQVEGWLACNSVWVPGPTEAHVQVLGGLLRGQAFKSNLVPDAHLAALALEHGLTLYSTDGDFARFPNLRWENPLATRTGD